MQNPKHIRTSIRCCVDVKRCLRWALTFAEVAAKTFGALKPCWCSHIPGSYTARSLHSRGGCNEYSVELFDVHWTARRNILVELSMRIVLVYPRFKKSRRECSISISMSKNLKEPCQPARPVARVSHYWLERRALGTGMCFSSSSHRRHS